MGYIYKIWNDINDKLYIGQTSRRLSERWGSHCSDSKTGHTKFYNAIKKYGIENFHIDIIEQVPDEDMNKREEFWIKFYNSYHDGYNSTLGGEGGKLSDISKEKVEELWEQGFGISEIADQLKTSRTIIRNRIYDSNLYSEEEAQDRGFRARNKSKEKPIIALTNDGIVVAKYSSGREAAEKIGVSYKAISQALRKGGRSGGYYWQYANKEKAEKGKAKKVSQYSLSGEKIASYDSVAEACKTTGAKKSGIYACCNNQQKTSYGFIWKYEE